LAAAKTIAGVTGPLVRKAKPKGAFDVCYALNSGTKADVAGGLRWATGLNRSRGRTPRLATRRSNRRQLMLTSGQLARSWRWSDDRGRADLEVRGGPLHKSHLNPAFSIVIVRTVALIAPSPGILTQAELQML
jgi:hypothetical protein